MKRLLAQIGITYFSVLAAAFYLPQIAVWIIGGVGIVLSVAFFFVRNIRKTIYIPAMAVAVVIACAVHIGYGTFIVRPIVTSYGDETHKVTAVVSDEPYQSYNKHYYRLKTTRIDGEDVKIKLLLKTPSDLEAQPDDVLTFSSMLKVTDNNYYRAKGYYLVSDEYETTVEVETPDSHSLYYRAIELRRFMRKTLEKYLPDDCAALCRAVLIGDKYAMSLDTRDAFRYAGASYFIVVSGMHFAVVIMLLFRLMKRLNRWLRFALIMAFILIYAAVTGFQSSVLRAGIMMVFTVLGLTIMRQPYPLNHLGIAGIVLPFIVSPYGAGDVGLILSFYATMGILLWASPILTKLCLKEKSGYIPFFRVKDRIRRYYERKRNGLPLRDESDQPLTFRLLMMKLWNSVAALLSVSLAANIMVFPISVLLFREFSLVTLLSSVLLYWEIYLILVLSLVICVFFWFKPFAILLSYPLVWLCRLVLWIVDGLASLPFAYCRISGVYIYVWMALTILLGIIVMLYRNQYRYLKIAALSSAVILLGGVLTNALLQSQVFSLEVYSCGNSICAGINKGGKLYLLQMDANSENLYPLWDELSYRFDGAESALCCNQREISHYQLYRDDEFAISTLLLYDNSGQYQREANVVPFDNDSTFIVDDEITIHVSVIDDKAVPYVVAGDRRILIVPKDCGIDEIPSEYRTADVILLTRALDGMEQLRCNDLIVSDDSELSLRTAGALRDCYQHVYCTDNGDVAYRLR